MPFDTFPCRWSLGDPVDVGRGASFERLRGAVHGTRDEAAVLADDGERTVGARVTLDYTPRLVASIDDGGALGVMGHGDGWSTLEAPCIHVVRDDDFALIDRVALSDVDGTCRVEQDDLASFDVTQVGGALDVAAIRRRFPSGESLTTSLRAAGAVAASTLRTEDGVVVAWVDGEGRAFARRSDAAGVAEVELGSGALDVAIVRDWFRPAAVIEVRRPLSDATTLHRWPFDAPSADLLERFSTLALAEGMVSNETEAILALQDGTLVAKPLSGTMLRLSDRPAELEVTSARVVLRPGASRGGLVYARLEPDGSQVLRFRPLVCNR
jgi:hypothetical protein